MGGINIKMLAIIVLVIKASLTTKHGGCQYLTLGLNDLNGTHTGKAVVQQSDNKPDVQRESAGHEKDKNGNSTAKNDNSIEKKNVNSLYDIISGSKKQHAPNSNNINRFRNKDYDGKNQTNLARVIQPAKPNREDSSEDNTLNTADNDIQRTGHIQRSRSNEENYNGDRWSKEGMKIVIVPGKPRDSNQSTTRFPVTSGPRTKSKGPLNTFITVFLLLIIFGGVLFALGVALYPHCKIWNERRRNRIRRRTSAARTRIINITPHPHHSKSTSNKIRTSDYNYVDRGLYVADYLNDLNKSKNNNNNNYNDMLSFDDNDDNYDDENDDDTCSVPFTPVSGFAPSPIATRTPVLTPRDLRRQNNTPASADSTAKKLPRTSTHRYTHMPCVSNSSTNRSISWDNTDRSENKKNVQSKSKIFFPVASSNNNSSTENISNTATNPDSGVLSDMTNRDRSYMRRDKQGMGNTSKKSVPTQFLEGNEENVGQRNSFGQLPGNLTSFGAHPGYHVPRAPLVMNNEVSL